MNEQLPLSPQQAIRAHQWLESNFGSEISVAFTDTEYEPVLASAIFCQETAQRVQLWFKDYQADICLQRSIFDASGDVAGTSRVAFPKNAAEFHTRYGDEFTDMLISEANKMRAMPQPGDADGWGPSHYLYKGYGIFQYDLQHVLTDEEFFRGKQWYNIYECVKRLVSELNKKRSDTLFETVRKYNGAGQNAVNYANNVFKFLEILKQ